MQIKTKIVSCHGADSKQVKQEVNGIVILPPLEFPAETLVEYLRANPRSLPLYNKTSFLIEFIPKELFTRHTNITTKLHWKLLMEPTRVKHLTGAPLEGRLLALPTNTRPGWKSLPVTNPLAYYGNL